MSLEIIVGAAAKSGAGRREESSPEEEAKTGGLWARNTILKMKGSAAAHSRREGVKLIDDCFPAFMQESTRVSTLCLLCDTPREKALYPPEKALVRPPSTGLPARFCIFYAPSANP